MITPIGGENLTLDNGILYIGELDDDGLPTLGIRDVGNCSAIVQTITPDILEKKERRTPARGLYHSVTRETAVEVKITLDEVTVENLIVHHLATEAAYGQGATTLTDFAFASNVVQGLYYPVGKRGLSSVVVEVGGSAKTLNTDYTVDADLGLIYVVPGGGISDGDDLTISATVAAVSSRCVRIATAPNVSRYLLFKSAPTSGPTFDIELWKVRLTPDGDHGIITDDFATLQLTGKVLLDSVNHPTEPYGRKILRAAA